MEFGDIDYAREIFTDLVVAWMAKTSQPPNASESRALSEQAFELAKAYGVAMRLRISSSVKNCPAKPSLEDKPGLSSSVMTFEQAANLWMVNAVKRSPAHSRHLAKCFERYVLPHLGGRPVGDVQSQELLSVIKSIDQSGRPSLAYRIFTEFRFMYRYVLMEGLSNRDPTAEISRAVNKPRYKGAAVSLDTATIGRLLVTIKDYKGKTHSTAPYALRLAPIVFLRQSELRFLEWKDVDFDCRTIVIPGSRMKMGRPHVVPLARQAVALLREVHKMTDHKRYVFTGQAAGKPLNIATFYAMLLRKGFRRLVLPHGFRTLASTWLNEQGWGAEAIERQLSHVERNRSRRLYNRAEYMPERRKMMQAWADHLEALERKARRAPRAGLASQLAAGGVNASV